jgi:hypothetical protein
VVFSTAATLHMRAAAERIRKAAEREPSNVYAAAALAAFDKDAGLKLLRQRIGSVNEGERRWIWATLHRANVFSAREKAQAMIDYARFIADPENLRRIPSIWDAPLPFEVSLGRYVAMNLPSHGEAAEQLASMLGHENDAVGDRLLLILAHAPTSRVATAICRHIGRGDAGPGTIRYVLAHREAFAAAASRQLAREREPEGAALMAVVAGDAAAAVRLAHHDASTATVVLAASRLALLPLPDVPRNGSDEARVAYLAAVDTPASREMLFRSTKDGISGNPALPQASSEPGIGEPAAACGCGSGVDPDEEQWRQEARASEIIVLNSFAGPCGFRGAPVIVRIRDGTATLTAPSQHLEGELHVADPYGVVRPLTPAELRELRVWIAEWEAEPGVTEQPVTRGGYRELFYGTPRGARRAIAPVRSLLPVPALMLESLARSR